MKSADHKRPLKVFLCHAHADRDPVRALVHAPDQRRRGRLAGQRKTPPRAGLGIGDSQGCTNVTDL